MRLVPACLEVTQKSNHPAFYILRGRTVPATIWEFVVRGAKAHASWRSYESVIDTSRLASERWRGINPNHYCFPFAGIVPLVLRITVEVQTISGFQRVVFARDRNV
jgi:hypothetical protein